MLMYKVVYDLLCLFREIQVYQMKVVTGDFVLHPTTLIRQWAQSEYVSVDKVRLVQINYSCMLNVVEDLPFSDTEHTIADIDRHL